MQVAEFTKKKTLESVACPPVIMIEFEDELEDVTEQFVGTETNISEMEREVADEGKHKIHIVNKVSRYVASQQFVFRSPHQRTQHVEVIRSAI